jgi:ABC-type transporter Mla subunit MlaD
MPAVDFDRQAIERRDFPIARRGYEPAAVDAHLRALAGEIEQLQRELSDGGGQTSLASSAGTQVQSILAAAEAAAAELEREAADSARTTREQADRDAVRTREEAIAQARAHVAAVAQATAVLLERVSAMDAQVGALVDSVRAGADRLASDLSAVEANMGELYDAAAGQSVTRAVAGQPPAQPSISASPAPLQPAPQSAGRAPAPPILSPASGAAAEHVRPAQGDPPPLSPPEVAEPQVHVDPEAPDNGDLDGARLIALNMALNGESREDADRYLAENFQLADRGKLIDEVYAAIES